MAGLVVISESAGPLTQNAVDVCVSAIPQQIRFTIYTTPELIWAPIAAHRDPLNSWHIECVPLIEWLRLTLRNEPTLKATRPGEQP